MAESERRTVSLLLRVDPKTAARRLTSSSLDLSSSKSEKAVVAGLAMLLLCLFCTETIW